MKNFTKEFQGIFKEISRNFAEFSREKTVLVASRIGAFKENSKNFKGNFKEFQGWERESGSLDHGSLDHGSVSPGASIKEFQEISRNFKDGSVSPGASIMGASTLWGHIMYFLMFDIYSVTAGVCWGPHVAA